MIIKCHHCYRTITAAKPRYVELPPYKFGEGLKQICVPCFDGASIKDPKKFTLQIKINHAKKRR